MITVMDCYGCKFRGIVVKAPCDSCHLTPDGTPSNYVPSEFSVSSVPSVDNRYVLEL